MPRTVYTEDEVRRLIVDLRKFVIIRHTCMIDGCRKPATAKVYYDDQREVIDIKVCDSHAKEFETFIEERRSQGKG